MRLTDVGAPFKFESIQSQFSLVLFFEASDYGENEVNIYVELIQYCQLN